MRYVSLLLLFLLFTPRVFAQSSFPGIASGVGQYVPPAITTAVTPNQSTVVSKSGATPCTSSLAPKVVVSTTGDMVGLAFNSSASGTGAPVAPTIASVSGGFVKAVQTTSTDLTNDSEIWYALNQTASATPTGPTVTLNAGTAGAGGNCFVGINIHDFSNVNTASALDQTASGSSTTAAISSIAFQAGALGGCASNCVTLTFSSNPFTSDGTTIAVADSPTAGNNGNTFVTISHTATTVLYTNASGAACASSCGIAVIRTTALSTGTTAATAQANELVITTAGYQPPAVGNNSSISIDSWTPASATELTDPGPGVTASANLYNLEAFQLPTTIGTQTQTWTAHNFILEYTGAIATFKVSASTKGALSSLNLFPNNLAGLSLTSNSVDYHCAPFLPDQSGTGLCGSTCAYATNPVHLPSAGGTGSGGIDASQHADLEPPSGYLGYQWFLVAQIDNSQNNIPVYVPKAHFGMFHIPIGADVNTLHWVDNISPVSQQYTIAAGGFGQMTLGGTGIAIGTPSIPADLGVGQLNFNNTTAATTCVQMNLLVWTLPVRYQMNPFDLLNGSNSIGVAGILE